MYIQYVYIYIYVCVYYIYIHLCILVAAWSGCQKLVHTAQHHKACQDRLILAVTFAPLLFNLGSLWTNNPYRSLFLISHSTCKYIYICIYICIYITIYIHNSYFDVLCVRLGKGFSPSFRRNRTLEIPTAGALFAVQLQPLSEKRWVKHHGATSQETISGWWARATPLKNMSPSIGMMKETLYISGKIKLMFQTTNQICISIYIYIYIHIVIPK